MTTVLADRIARTIVLVGMMGAGKSTVGRRVATRLGLRFVDADAEIEAAAGCPIEDIFERHGEAAFRDGEHRVIARLLEQPVHVLAAGGGAFSDPRTRDVIRRRGVSVWLRADVDLLQRRVARRNNRPLLKSGNLRETLDRLVTERYPIYAQADIIIDSEDGPPDRTVDRVIRSLEDHFGRKEEQPPKSEAAPS